MMVRGWHPTKRSDIKRVEKMLRDGRAVEKQAEVVKQRQPRKAPVHLAIGANVWGRVCPWPGCGGFAEFTGKGMVGTTAVYWFACTICRGHYGYPNRKPSTPVRWYVAAGTAQPVEIPQAATTKENGNDTAAV